MLSLAASTVLALAVASVSASGHTFSRLRRHHVPRAEPPAGWATGYLEVYDVYHERYLAIGCENQHNTSFFDFCCHPLLVSTRSSPVSPFSPRSRPPRASRRTARRAARSARLPSAPECDEEDGDDEDDSGDDDDEDCESEEESSTVKVATTSAIKVATTTAQAATTTTQAVTSSALRMTTAATTTKAATTAQATTTKATTKATTTSTAETSTKTSSSSPGGLISGGFGTWFTQNGVAGACGTVHKDTDFVVALQTKMYANGAHCGKSIKVINTVNGKSVQGTVADECPTCDNVYSVDMSVAMFEQLDALSVGEFAIQWELL
ncbi:RlpA-like double-psi beta-barrel-protein domain-containing protein-containing protein [Mycena latifolia]|nr:RlpA-like double-psi beta-barrel-protein domain-containing protein-containing protein [Mycena latifolia]